MYLYLCLCMQMYLYLYLCLQMYLYLYLCMHMYLCMHTHTSYARQHVCCPWFPFLHICFNHSKLHTYVPLQLSHSTGRLVCTPELFHPAIFVKIPLSCRDKDFIKKVFLKPLFVVGIKSKPPLWFC